jgi:hypothetical protein
MKLAPLLLLLCGCAFNRPHFRETVTSTNGTVTVRELTVPTWALWPATASLDRQRASLGRTFSLGQSGLEQDGGGSTNALETLKALDAILGKVLGK